MQEAAWLTLEEVCQYLKIGRTTIYKMARLGKIPASKVGNRWRFSRTEIDNWMHHNREKGGRRGAKRRSK